MAELEKPDTLEDEEDDEDDYIRLFSHSGQFFLEEPYIYLINPDLFPERVAYIRDFSMKEILPDFHRKLQKQGLDFRILGQAIYSASRIHKKKVSLAIQYEKKQEEKLAIRAKRREFQFKIPLHFYATRDLLALAESANPESFYAELLLALQEEDEKKKLEKIKAERKLMKGDVKRQRRKLELADFESFDYELDLDRVAIEDIVNNTFEIIKEIALKDKNKEAEFTKVVRQMEMESQSDEQRRLIRARVLISCLYLFRDEFITAEQELNPPYEIYIQITKFGMRKK
ncbi:MAG: hypothetical protein JSU57_00945 [Candidatus Heimdallarchaeota archaeon]|nr:MAG: hypothetical protein JSU57_00945 [Candidatus Heimdallarchaeota archaeon]